MKTYVVGTHKKRLAEVLLMSTHNICFHGEIKKILCGYPLLSVAIKPWTYIYHYTKYKPNPSYGLENMHY